MSAEQQAQQERRFRIPWPKGKIPSWFIAAAVVITGAITALAMWARGDGWPPTDMPMRLAQAASPMYGAVGAPPPPGTVPAPQLRPVAANQAVPTIQAGARSKHADRGACALCHVVVDKVGTRIPMITAYAALPHPYRGGLCINCHQLKQTSNLGNLLPMAAARPGAAIQAPAPTEAAWMGMEVAPMTPAIASQYNIPQGIKGVVVTEVESTARLAGIQAGDVVIGVDQSAITDMGSFVAATGNGKRPEGTVQLLRGGKLARVTLGGASNNAGLAAAQRNNVGGGRLNLGIQGQGLGLGIGRGATGNQGAGQGQQWSATPPCPNNRF